MRVLNASLLALLVLAGAPVRAQDGAAPGQDAAANAGNGNEFGVDYLLQNRTRLDAIQMRVRAQRSLLEWTRQQTLKTMDEKFNQEQERVQEAYDSIVKQMRAQGRERHRQLIEELERYVLRYSGTQASGDLYLRLAELYFEEANFDFIEAMEAYDKNIDRYYEGEIDVEPELPAPDYTKAIELYEEFTQAYPNHRYIQEAIYLYAFTLEESGREDEAVEQYERLLERDPDGPLAPEVAFRIGEYYFLTGELEKSAEVYRHTIRLKDENFYDKALYKLAWTYYRMGDYEAALLGFTEMVDYSTQAEAISATDMREESLQYIAIIFSERGGLEGMQAYFKDLGGRPYEIEAMAKLGEIYAETADHQNALDVYEVLLERQPMTEQAPDLLRNIEDAWLKMEREPKVVEQWKRFADHVGPGSDWFRQWSGKQPNFASEVSKEAEKKRLDYALYIHSQGQEARTAAERQARYDEALAAYETFSDQFPDSTKLADVTFNRAEIHYEMQQWAKAGALYRQVPEIVIDPTSELFETSAWNMILSFRKDLEDYEATPAGKRRLQAEAAERAKREAAAEEKRAEEGTGAAQRAAAAEATGATAAEVTAAAADAAKPKPHEQRASGDQTSAEAKPPGPKTLPGEAITLIKASLYYVKLYPLGERSPAVYYNTGDIFFAYGMYSRARSQYLSFVERFPDNEFLMDGIKQITRTYLIEERFGDLVSWGYSLIDTPLWNRPEVEAYFTKILSGAIFKDAQQLEAQGDRVKAAETYLRMVDAFPESEFVDEALLNAAVAYQKQGNWDRSTDVYLRFYQEFPEHKQAPQALFQTAWNAERVLDFNGAVSRYTELLDTYPTDERTKDALFNAATILAKLGKDRRAAELYLLYIERFPGEEDEADNLFFAAKAYYQDGDYETAKQVFQRFNRHPDRNEREVEATYILAQIAKEQEETQRYYDLLAQVIDKHKQYTEEDEAVDPAFAGEASYRLAERVDDNYQAVKLRLPMEVMSNLLEQKAEQLTKVEEAYSKVILFKDPYWSSAALHRIGAAYQHFANTLFDAPVPDELSAEEADFYRMELEDQAFPIEDKAMQYWQRNIDLAVKIGISNEWVQESREKLLQLFPDVAQVKEEERWEEASNEFYYRFPMSTDEDADVKIEGAEITYLETDYRVENIEERYAIARTWSDRQRKVVLDFPMPEPVLIQDGRPIELEGIKDLWRRSF